MDCDSCYLVDKTECPRDNEESTYWGLCNAYINKNKKSEEKILKNVKDVLFKLDMILPEIKYKSADGNFSYTFNGHFLGAGVEKPESPLTSEQIEEFTKELETLCSKYKIKLQGWCGQDIVGKKFIGFHNIKDDDTMLNIIDMVINYGRLYQSGREKLHNVCIGI